MGKKILESIDLEIKNLDDYKAKAKELKAGLKALKDIKKKKSKISKLEKERIKLMKKIRKRK